MVKGLYKKIRKYIAWEMGITVNEIKIKTSMQTSIKKN